MGKLIALAASCGVQIVVETHSDHLMDGIRIAVKEQKIAADKVAFQYFTKKPNEPSEVTSPKLHDNGKLDFWPEGFFDQTLKNRAILARKG
jgi:predicted ATPase